jgi:hypothetical protein
MSGGHSRLDALNRPYADADIPGDFSHASIFRSVFPSVRLRPKTIGATS